jgi:hypothetical protein
LRRRHADESQSLAHVRFNARIDVRIRTHRAGEFSHRNRGARLLRPLDVTLNL